jgi:hypothetical protein
MTEKLPGFDPAAILIKRKQMQDDMENMDAPPPEVESFDPVDVKELKDFCARNGVIGFNFGSLSPKAALAMLKGQMGIQQDVVASMESMGHRVSGKNYQQDKQLLNG